MATATLGFLRFVLGIDGVGFEKGLDAAEKSMKASQKSLNAQAAKFKSVGLALSAAVTAPLIGLAATGIAEARETQAAMAQVNAALASTAGAAGVTAAQLTKAADSLELSSLYEADQILNDVSARLLAFGNVTGATFMRAQQAIVDFATRSGKDLPAATLLIGKALNDPAKAMGVLRKAGVMLSADQAALVTSMAATGNTAGAQAIILDALAVSFGGAAKAAQDVDPMNKLNDAFKQMAEKVGTALIPMLTSLGNGLVTLLDKFNNLSPTTQKWVMIAGGIVAALGPVLIAVGSLAYAFATLLPLFSGTAGAAGLGGILAVLGPVAIAIAAAVAAWMLFGDKIGPVLSQLGAKFSEVLGPKFTALIATVQKVLTTLWNGPLGDAVRVVIGVIGNFMAAYMSAFGEGLVRVLGAAIEIVGGTFTAIGNAIKVVVALLSGDWAGAWAGAKALIVGVTNTILAVFQSLVPEVTSAMRSLYTGVKTWLLDKLNAVWTGVEAGINKVKGWFFGLYDAVVGHSYIPDMVDGISHHIARLDGAMVKPIQAMTAKSSEAFKVMAASTQGLLDRLFPEQAAVTKLQADYAALDAALAAKLITPAVYAAARDRLHAEMQKLGDEAQRSLKLVFDDIARNDQVDQEIHDKITGFASDLSGTLGDPVKRTTAQVADDFARMAQDVVGSFRNLGDAIKNGDILDILDAVLGTITTVLSALGNLGVIKGAPPPASSFGGFRAAGGPVMPGKSYVVGENGPEWFTPSGRGAIAPNGGGGGMSLRVVPSPYFSVVVDQRATAVAAPIGVRAAAAGSQGAQMAQARANRQRLAA